MLYIISLSVLVASGFADYYTGKLTDGFSNVREKNPFGALIGSFGSVIISGVIMTLLYYINNRPWYLVIPNFAFAARHFYAAFSNYKLYLRLRKK